MSTHQIDSQSSPEHLWKLGHDLRRSTESIAGVPPEARQRALQEELFSLIGVVGAAPLVELLLERAFELGATDIHFDPAIDGVMIRLRLDGVMHNILKLDTEQAQSVISRVKIMASMNITERRGAQDGRISTQVLNVFRDVRVSSLPTIYGARIVMRLISGVDRLSSFSELGMTHAQIEQVDRAIHSPHGVTLSVGPIGTGKSTTIYNCLAALNNPQLSLASIEDPVERRIDGVNQVQVDTKAEFGFVEALRGLLRQDPNILMIGEIRDPETAQIAIHAGLTGIRVLSTLHASNTGATIDMFREYQIPRMFLADALKCVIAQRLLRKVCSKDREYFSPDAATAEYLQLTPAEAEATRLVRGIPSDANFHSGYYGRTGAFEVMTIDADLRELLISGKPGKSIYEECQKKGMQTLHQNAREKVLAGETSIEELLRVLL